MGVDGTLGPCFGLDGILGLGFGLDEAFGPVSWFGHALDDFLTAYETYSLQSFETSRLRLGQILEYFERKLRLQSSLFA